MSRKFRGIVAEKVLSPQEQQSLVNEIKKQIGPAANRFPKLFSDASILRFLRARNWNVKKATKMLKEAYKWQMDFKPEKLQWEDITHEAKTGKIYRANYVDKLGRPVVVMKPGAQNTTSSEGQIKYLVYIMERTIMSMEPGQEQMVWLVDFQGYATSKVSFKTTKDTARILQNCYPERLGLAILYNPPKVFETFFAMVKPILEQKTYKKVKFAYSNDPQSRKIMESVFDMDKLESVFGGKSTVRFDFEAYARQMKEEDTKMSDINSECPHPPDMPGLLHAHSLTSGDESSDASDDDHHDQHLNDEMLSHLEGIDENPGVESENTKDVANVESNGHKAKEVEEGHKTEAAEEGHT